MCVWWSGREWNLPTVRGVTGAPSASAYSLKKNAIFVSGGVSCMCAQCWAGHLIPRQRAGETYEIYALPARFTVNLEHIPLYTTLPAKIGTLHTLQHFTPGSVPSRPSYARSTQIADVPRCLSLFWDLPSAPFPPRALSPSSSCLGGVAASGPAKRAQPPVNFSG